jgi:hypothetical protein
MKWSSRIEKPCATSYLISASTVLGTPRSVTAPKDSVTSTEDNFTSAA